MKRRCQSKLEVQDVLSKIDLRKTVSALKEMVQIKTENPPGNEEPLCQYIDEKLRSLGFKTELVFFQNKRPSLVGTFSSHRKSRFIALNGHTDTVRIGERSTWSVDPFGCKIAEGKVFGRGTCDMKGGLASMIVALETVANSEFEPTNDWIFTFSSDEEDLGRGTMALVKSGSFRGASLAIFGEPTAMKVVTAHRGSVWLEVSAHGVAAHGSMPDIGANSIVAAGDVVGHLSEVFSSRKSFTTPGSVSLNVGTIHGGTRINVVPNTCTVGLDFRYDLAYNPDQLVTMLKNILVTVNKENPKVQFSLKELQRRLPVNTDATNFWVRRCLKLVSTVLGKEDKPASMAYSTDASIVAQHVGIPVVVLGPGKPELAHKTDENVELAALEDATKVYTALILAL